MTVTTTGHLISSLGRCVSGPHSDHVILSLSLRVADHSAIGDIIDDDGTGHITVLKLNAFLTGRNRRRPDWTIPQWFAL